MKHSVEILVIPEQQDLDSITVYWHNYSPGKGMVTIICWGCAWNAYFGGMEASIQDFFRWADIPYLVCKLGITQWLKHSKAHDKYLGRLVQAVKDAMDAPAALQPHSAPPGTQD